MNIYGPKIGRLTLGLEACVNHFRYPVSIGAVLQAPADSAWPEAGALMLVHPLWERIPLSGATP